MRLTTPLKISFFLSFVIFAFLFIVFSFLKNYLSFPYLIFFVCTFFFIYLVLKKLFYEKIKVIYKNIYKFSGSSNIKNLDIEFVEKQAEEWADAKEAELNEYKKDQNYRREFLGNVSHELKTPIFNIQGYIQTLLDGGLNDSMINIKYLQRTNKSVERMINIVDDLEVISRLETEQSALDFQTFNIINLVKDVFDSFELQAKKMDIHLETINNSKSKLVIGDTNKIHQVFINLISNSIKYGKKGGTTSVNFFDMDKNILIEISDNGIGIESASLNRLFERFYRVDKNRSREIGGTGLGLAIVKHILEGHNQQIKVRSTIGVGTTFSFTLKKA